MFASRQRRACTGVGLNRKFTVRKFSGGKEWVPAAPCKYAHTNLKSESTLVPCTYSKAGKNVAELCRKKTCCRENNRGSLSDSLGVLPGGAAALSPQVRPIFAKQKSRLVGKKSRLPGSLICFRKTADMRRRFARSKIYGE